MAGDCGELITKFLLNTCRLCPPPDLFALRAALGCVQQATRHPEDEPEADFIPSTTGSVAEFYIEPMLLCIGDIDWMGHRSTELAIPAGHPPPTQLPADFHSYVRLHEIIDSEWPGYVYLSLSGLLTERQDDNNYTFWREEGRRNYTSHKMYLYGNVNVHGPAVTASSSGMQEALKGRLPGVTILSVDGVFCIRCLEWPPQAADWPTRHREYGWPDSATVNRVVSNGCDVVHVAHPQCRQDEWEGKAQWRLSYSRAEVVLLNSWMPVQQIVYHMLRVFVKTERLTDSADNSGTKILSNYHIKTLMMWACELKPRDWWIDRLNLVRTCTELLHTLAVWLNDGRCQNYFIDNCNLLDNVGYCHIIANDLLSVTESWLSTWFVRNYMQRCFQLCPDKVSQLYKDMSTTKELNNAVSALVNCKWNRPTLLLTYHGMLEGTAGNLVGQIYPRFLTVRSAIQCMSELKRLKLGKSLDVYFIAVVFLHVTQKTRASDTLCCEFVDVLATVFLHGSGTTEQLRRKQRNSQQTFRTATQLMQLAAGNSSGALALIQIELAKAYLYRVLSCKDSDSDSIYCLANVYLAALYYTTGQYQTAIDHSTLVKRSEDHSRCSSYVIEATLLPKLNNNTDSILGLVTFYQYIRASSWHQQHTRYANVFTTEPFAHYLNIASLQLASECGRTQRHAEIEAYCQYQMHLSQIQQLMLTDVLLATRLQKHFFQYKEQPSNQSQNRPITNLKELLLRSAVEHLTTFRQLHLRYFRSVATIVTTDFEALYAYKCGEYQHCLHLCRRNVRTLIYSVVMSPVFAYPEFNQLMDNDIVSLVGLTLIVNPAWGDVDPNATYISQLTLSLYLLTQCQLKLRHSATSLAETLDYVESAQRGHPVDRTLDQLTLQLIERRIRTHVSAHLA